MLTGKSEESHYERLKERILRENEDLRSQWRLLHGVQSVITSLMTSRLIDEGLRFPSEVILILRQVISCIVQKKIALARNYRKLNWLEENKENIDIQSEKEMNMEDPD